MRFLLLLLLFASPEAVAQTAFSCVPYPFETVSGADPVTFPEPFANQSLAPASPTARVERALRSQLAGRAPAGACPTLRQARPWAPSGWLPDTLRTEATYTDSGQTTLIERHDDASGQLTYRATLVYDGQDRILEFIAEDGVPLAPTIRWSYAYDADGRLAQVQLDLAGQDGLDPFVRESYTYDGARATGLFTEFWTDGAWAPDFRSTRTFTAAGLRLEFIDEAYQDGSWQLLNRYQHTYDDAGRLTLLHEDWHDGSEWVPSSRIVRSYDAASRLVRHARQRPDGGVLTDVDVVEFTYDGERLAEAVVQARVDFAELAPVSRTQYVYADGALASSTDDTYQDGAWQPAARRLYTRDATGRPTALVEQAWEADVFVNQAQTRSAYDGMVASEQAPADGALAFTVGPNPTRDRAAVRLDLDQPGTVWVEVSDVLGRRVSRAEHAVPAGASAVEVDLSGQAPGLYVVRVSAAGMAAARRITVAR